MIPKQKVIEMLFADITEYQSKFDINKNTQEENLKSIHKAEALNDFAKKLNKL